MLVHDPGTADIRRAEGLQLIDDIYRANPLAVKRRSRLITLNTLDILKDIGANPNVPTANPLFVAAIRQLTTYTEIPNHPMALEVQKKNMIDESGIRPIPICFLQTLTPSEYREQLANGRPPADPAAYQNKLPFVRYAFQESGYSCSEIAGRDVIEILTAASYFDPGSRRKFGDPNVVSDTDAAYAIGGAPGSAYYDVLALMGFGSAIRKFGVGNVQQDGSLTVGLEGAAGKAFLTTQSMINRNFSCIAGQDMSISNPVKNNYLLNPANDYRDQATVETAARYMLYKALGDAMQVILARLVIGAATRNADRQYCLFTVDSVVAAKCVELQIPVCRQCSVKEYSKEKADLGQSFYYAPTSVAERDTLEFNMLVSDISQHNVKVLGNIRRFLAFIRAENAANPDRPIAERQILVMIGAKEINLKDKFRDVEALFMTLETAITAVNAYLPTCRADFPSIREIECFRANMINDGATIFTTDSLFHTTYIDQRARLPALPADPIYGVELTIRIKTIEPTVRRRVQRGGQRGGAWDSGDTANRNFTMEYYQTIIAIVTTILGSNPAIVQPMMDRYNETAPTGAFVFDIAYHFIISTAAYFNYIGFSCTDVETLYPIVFHFMTIIPPQRISFHQFETRFYSLPKPTILLQNNRDIEDAQEEEDDEETTPFTEWKHKTVLPPSSTPPFSIRKTVKAPVAPVASVKKRYVNVAKAHHSKRRRSGILGVGVPSLTGKTVRRGGARRTRPSNRSKGATVKRVRSPARKTRKMRRRAISHVRE